ncbi:MAG: hypothetical protein AAFX56_00715 [Pseudomonadota bacterium]
MHSPYRGWRFTLLSDEDLKTHLERFGDATAKRRDSGKIKLIREVKQELVSRGSVARGDLFIQGIGAVCVPVEAQYSGEALVIGVVGPSDRISQHESEHRDALDRVLTEFRITCRFGVGGARKTA